MVYEPLITHNIPYYAYFWNGKDFGPHWHSEMEVMHCLQGQILVKIDDREFLLTDGMTLILRGNEPHRFFCDNKDTRMMIVKFGYSLLGSRFSQIQGKSVYHDLQTMHEALSKPLCTLRDRLLKDGAINDCNEWFIRSQVYLLADGLNNVENEVRPSDNQVARTARLDSIYPVLDLVRHHYKEPITIDDAANCTGYAKTYFCRQFKQTTGVSFHRYLNRYRVSVACLLLEDSKLTVAQVAAQTGFSSSKLFCRTFKEVTGMTTGQYQRLPAQQKDRQWSL